MGTVYEAVFVHVPLVPVTRYVVVILGLATGLAIEGEESDSSGDHKYEPGIGFLSS